MQSRIIDPKELLKKNPVLQYIDLSLCVDCKAVKKLCGMAKCPLIDALDVYPSEETYQKISGNSVFGPSPQIFVGSSGYPRVNTGPLTSILEDESFVHKAGDPSQWVDLDLKDIISLRYGMVRGKKNLYIKKSDRSEKLYNQLSELTLSIEPVETESLFSTLPRLNSTFDIETQPMGPSGTLARMDITSNPKIPKIVDYVLGDEITATEQINKLYQENYDVYYLQNILSAGLTGLQHNQKLVPTRWSITATDDIVGKKLIGKDIIPKLRDWPSIQSIEVRRGILLGNEYTSILAPGEWSFENFETWIAGNIFALKSQTKWQMSYCHEGFTKKEYYKGRTSYASQAGGYYASRLAVLQHLEQRQRKARVMILREITPDYLVPVGVWQVREGMRKTMKDNPIYFSTMDEVQNFLVGKLNVPIQEYFGKANSIRQKSLDEFF